jgi:MinD-like ATPase involved in chromosome partitioning or flagellar assembly
MSTDTTPVQFLDVTITDGRVTINGEAVKTGRKPALEVAATRCAEIAIAAGRALPVRLNTDGHYEGFMALANGDITPATANLTPLGDLTMQAAPGTAAGADTTVTLPRPDPTPPPAPAGQPASMRRVFDFDDDDEPAMTAPATRPAVLTPTPATPTPLPTFEDLRAKAAQPPVPPSTILWRRALNKGPSAEEQARRADIATIQGDIDDSRTVVFVNTKGGTGKTTAVRQVAATCGRARGGYVLAWDDNETTGNLGSRTLRPSRTVVDLIRDLPRFNDPVHSGVGDLAAYVGAQGDDRFDVLASSLSAADMEDIGGEEFDRVRAVLARWYRLILVDTGNNMRATNYQAALDACDQLVIVAKVAEDAGEGAARLVEDLRTLGRGKLVDQAVTVLTPGADLSGWKRRHARHARDTVHVNLRQHFEAHTRAVLDVPFDPALVSGALIEQRLLSAATVRAWERVAATIVAPLLRWP